MLYLKGAGLLNKARALHQAVRAAGQAFGKGALYISRPSHTGSRAYYSTSRNLVKRFDDAFSAGGVSPSPTPARDSDVNNVLPHLPSAAQAHRRHAIVTLSRTFDNTTTKRLLRQAACFRQSLRLRKTLGTAKPRRAKATEKPDKTAVPRPNGTHAQPIN
jgi:hypothetical protein